MSRPPHLPYVVVAVVGQRLVIRNQDATAHNVAAMAGTEPLLNNAQPEGSPPIERTIIEAGATCAATWSGDHAQAAVTDESGQFRLRDVPAGQYDLEAWHPHLQRM